MTVKDEGAKVSQTALRAASAALDKVREGNLDARLDTADARGEFKALLEQVNEVLATLDARTQEMHSATMDMALGLSDCFEALSQVRGGNLQARVSEATLASTSELLAKFANVLNATLGDIEQTIERQRFAIQTLSTPILRVWDDVLALPVIGVVDTQRSAEIMEKLLAAIVEQQARYVILDITGVEVVDTKTADHFIKVINSARLLGAQCLLTGIQPAVAQTLVDIGIDLSSVTTLRNLQDGLRECLRRMDVRQKLSAKAGTAAGQAV